MVARRLSTKRRIMRDFTITEISAVDSPAQQGARAVIAKRDYSQETDDMFTKITEHPRAFSSLEEAMAAIRKSEGCAHHVAMSEAARRFPELHKRYNQEGEQVAKAARDAATPRPVAKAVRDFHALVDDIATDRGVPRHTAMAIARESHPGLYLAYRES